MFVFQAADVAFKLQVLTAEPREFLAIFRNVLTAKGLPSAGVQLASEGGVLASKVAGIKYLGSSGTIGAKDEEGKQGDGAGGEEQGKSQGGNTILVVGIVCVVIVVLVLVMVMRYRKQKRQKDAFFERLDQEDDDNALDDDDDEWE